MRQKTRSIRLTRFAETGLDKSKHVGGHVCTFLALAMMLSACSTQPGEIKSFFGLGDDESVLIGARQRAILNNRVGKGSRPGLVNPDRVVCAEPSPDVGLAIAQSFGFGVSFLGGGGQGAASAAGATAEGVAQLAERTQSIQLLRDQMYRACEAYANGAISGSTYNLIMSKNNDAMITLMLGEVAGGAFGRAGAAIGGKSDSEGKAQVSLLVEALQAADKAAKDLDDAKETEKKAEEKVEDKKEIAAKDETESEEKKEGNNEEVDKAEGELAAAKDDVRRKRDAKNSADSKAKAEITKVVGAGSIAAKPSVGIAQSLARLQDSYLREDFVDEYLAACIVEMGLSPAGSLENIKKEALFASQTRAFLNAGFRDSANPKKVTPTLLENTRKAAKGYVEFVQSINTAERTTLFARHCNDNLQKFVIFARSSDLTLEQERIRLDFQRTLQEGEATRKASLEAFAVAMKTCGGIGDAESQKKCAEAATTIVNLPGGAVELGAVTKLEVPTGEPPLPLVAYDVAKKAKGAFDSQYNKLASVPIAAIPAATEVTKADHAALVKQHESLSAQRAVLTKTTGKNSAATLKQSAGAEIAAPKRAAIVSEQSKRPTLRSAVRTAGDKSKLELKSARQTLELHDTKAKLSQGKYEKLADRLDAMTREIRAHLTAVNKFNSAVEAAKKKKADNAG